MIAQSQPQYGCDSPESRQLDFWVGEWDLTYSAGGKEAKSRNRITKVLGGCVILEEFTGAPGTRLDGRSYSTYDRATKRWKQTWVDSEGTHLDFAGRSLVGAAAPARVVEDAFPAEELHDLHQVMLGDAEGRRHLADRRALVGLRREIDEQPQAVVGEGREAHAQAASCSGWSSKPSLPRLSSSFAAYSARNTAPMENTTSPGTRSQTIASMKVECTISGARAYQRPVVKLW